MADRGLFGGDPNTWLGLGLVSPWDPRAAKDPTNEIGRSVINTMPQSAQQSVAATILGESARQRVEAGQDPGIVGKQSAEIISQNPTLFGDQNAGIAKTALSALPQQQPAAVPGLPAGNPYDVTNPAFMAYVTGMKKTAMQGFADQQHQLSGAIGASGMMGSAAAAARRAALSGAQASTLAGIDTRANMQAYQKGGEYNLAVAGLGQQQQQLGLQQQQLDEAKRQYNLARDDAEKNKWLNAIVSLVSGGAKIASAVAPAVL